MFREMALSMSSISHHGKPTRTISTTPDLNFITLKEPKKESIKYASVHGTLTPWKKNLLTKMNVVADVESTSNSISHKFT